MLSCIGQSDRNLTNTMYDSAASGTLVMNIGLTLSARSETAARSGISRAREGAGDVASRQNCAVNGKGKKCMLCQEHRYRRASSCRLRRRKR